MIKEKLNKKEKETFLKILEKLCNSFITLGLSAEGMSMEEAAEEQEYKNSKLAMMTKDVFIKLVIGFLEDEKREGRDPGLSVKELKNLVEESLNKKILYIWGEGKFVVTKEFLNYIQKLKKDNKKVYFGEMTIHENKKTFQNIIIECPYCHNQTKIPSREGYSNVKCETCEKEFKLLTGRIKKIRGKPNAAVHYRTTEPISITIGVEKNEETINFNNNYRVLISKGDKISFIWVWKKPWFSNRVEKKLDQIMNWESKQSYKV